jgi:hypothetical protein
MKPFDGVRRVVRHESARSAADIEDVVRRTFTQESDTGSKKLHCLALEGEAGVYVLDFLPCLRGLAMAAASRLARSLTQAWTAFCR